MKLINPKAEYLPQAPGLEGVYKQIELAGRTCYKSEDKIIETSAPLFVDRLLKSAHTAMLEHGTIYLLIPTDEYSVARYFHKGTILASQFEVNPYSVTNYNEEESACITTNYRTLMEYFDEEDVDFIVRRYLCEPTEFHERRYTFRLTTSIGVTREIIRHRHLSFAEQSTRYCNFSRDKFGNEVTFCIPSWVDRNREPNTEAEVGWLESIKRAEGDYLYLISWGWQPQQAREVLPLSTASEIVVTGFASDWKHFFDLRLFDKTGKPHPNMEQLANLMKTEAEKAGIWEDIMSKPSKFE